MFRAKTQEVDRQSRPTRRWRIAHKLTIASVLMIVLTLLAGGVGLWQVFTIGRAIGDAHEREQQLVLSLELLASGHKLVAALDRMFMTQDPVLASTDVTPSLGTLSFYMEALQEAGGETGALDIFEEMQAAYDELHQAVNEVDLLARQELWTETGVALEQKVRPANEHMGLLIRRLVRQADRDVDAMAARTQVVVRQATLLLAGLVVLTTTIAWGWRHFVFRELSLSIGKLRQGVARISSGDLEYKLDVRTGDEIEELGDEFNKMADELANVIGSLEQRVAERTHELVEAKEALETACKDMEKQVEERTAELRQETVKRERLQQEVIEAQKRAIQELSTPIIPVMDRIIIMPLIGSIDSMRARDITRALLAGIRQQRAKVVILDITGVSLVDSGVAAHLNKTIQAARLKGARTIITGISDAVAETIVDLGIDWSGVETLGDLQTGLRAALAAMGMRVAGNVK